MLTSGAGKKKTNYHLTMPSAAELADQPTAAELAELEDMTEDEKLLLVKVQARVKGWARRNKNKKRLLEEAKVGTSS